MTTYVCTECGAEAVTESADRTTLPEDADLIIPNVTHCSNANCVKSDPNEATPSDFQPAQR